MYENYKSLTGFEKTLLSEIVCDEEWFANNKSEMENIFNGKFAPNGSEWCTAPFVKTQNEIRNKIIKGTKYETEK